MGVTQAGTDGTAYSGNMSWLTSGSYTFRHSDINRVLEITGGANCTLGSYVITAVNGSINTAFLSGSFETNTSASCHWALGPTRLVYAQVNPVNPPIPCFSKAGGPIITGGYTSNCVVLNEGFDSFNELASQVYPVPYGTSLSNSGFNAVEVAVTGNTANTWSSSYASQAAFANAQTSYINGIVAKLSLYPKLYLFGSADNITRGTGSLYGATEQTPATSWNPSGMATVANSLLVSGIPWLGVSWMDEINNWGQAPLEGPVKYGSPSAQNWLLSITASGGTCTATTSTAGNVYMTYGSAAGHQYTTFGGQFAVTGSAVANMNSTVGNLYTITPIDNTHFSFSCTGVSNGTYNSSNDPGLVLQTLSAGGWFTNPAGIIPYDAWANIVNQLNSVSNHTPFAGSQAGNSNAFSISCWEGGLTCGNSISEGSNVVSSISNWADLYWTHYQQEVFLTGRQSLNSLISDLGQAEEGFWLRSNYGQWDPAKPLTTITGASVAWYAYDSAVNSPLVSCTGNTITFASPHGITNIVPGLSRLVITGSTDSNCNTKLMILSVPSPTTITVAYAQAKTICSDTGSGTCGYNNGGTMHWLDGTTTALYEIATDGRAAPMGSTAYNSACNGGSGCPVYQSFDYGTSAMSAVNGCGGGGSSTITRKRGQTFTLTGVTGSAASYFNSTTFIYNIENLAQPTDANGSVSACQNYFREIPNFNGTGGTADITPDNLMVRGRTAFDGGLTPGLNADPRWTFGTVVECMAIGCSGHRLYAFFSNPQAYSPQESSAGTGGWTGNIALSAAGTYGELASQGVINQLGAHPNLETNNSVPQFWAASNASLIWSRLAPLYFQTRLNSPDYGPEIDCGARNGSNGALLICWNGTNGSETRTFALSTYESGGQSIVRYRVKYTGIEAITIISAGTSNDTITLDEGEAVFYAFPATFASWLQQPSVAVRLADVPGAADVVIRFNYDPYNLDAANYSYDCGASAACSLPVDKQIGTIYYRVIYRNSSGLVLATSDVEKL